MDYTVAISPITKSFQVTKIVLSVQSFYLLQTEMDVMVDFFTDDSKLVDRTIVHIPPDIHAQWGVDDAFIVDYVLTKLKLTKL